MIGIITIIITEIKILQMISLITTVETLIKEIRAKIKEISLSIKGNNNI